MKEINFTVGEDVWWPKKEEIDAARLLYGIARMEERQME